MNREEAKELLIHILMTYEPKDQYGDYDDPEPYEQALTMAIEALSERTGEWIFEKTDEYKRTYCSVCGGSAPFICVSDDYYGRRSHGETRKTDFCPNCGADMRGKEE